MKNAILISLLFVPLFKLSESKNRIIQNIQTIDIAFTNTSRYAILKPDNIPNYIFDKSYKAATLSDADLIRIERLINRAVSKNNKKSKYFYIENPSNYYKQLISVINPKGEKEVWVNCFCSIDGMAYWKTKVVGVLDGGSCYFNLKINLNKNTVFDFIVNNYE